MDNEAIVEQSTTPHESTRNPFPKTGWGKALAGAYILLMPVLLFFSTDLFKPEWQTGEFSDYVILSLFPQASLLFFPLLAYSIVCYWSLLIEAGRYASSFIVRLGIYTGLILALQYCVAILLSSPSTFGFVVGLVWFAYLLLQFLYPRVVHRWGIRKVIMVLAILVFGVWVVIAWRTNLVLVASYILDAFVGVLVIVAPFWILLQALRTTFWLIKNHESKLSRLQGAGFAVWFAGYLIAWRFDILKMYELYAALPPQPPPDCYIATAAAQGHPDFVGARKVLRADGESWQVNRQLQILKCAELALRAIHPRVHEVTRSVYDVVGKSLAHRIVNPFLADTAYILLKPLEWLARGILEILIPEIDSIAEKMYAHE